ncbi:MAG: hypothetical protein ACMG6S_05250, partial [Byssovorax sp.]
TSKEMHELFFSINREHKTTIVVVTHNLGFAASMPRIVTMRDGLVETDARTGADRDPVVSDGAPLVAEA